MTREEAEEKYGEVPLFFQSYYKYSFTFEGRAPDGNKIHGGFGGESDDVYRTHVTRDAPETLASLRWFKIFTPEGTVVCDAIDNRW